MSIPWFMQDPKKGYESYLSNNYLVLDFETTNINKGSPREPNNRIVMASWAVGQAHPSYKKNKGILSKFGGEFTQADLTRDIEQADFIVAQFTKFELQWLTRCGIELHKVLCYDTIIGAYVQDGNRKTSRDLSSLARRYGVPEKFSLISKMITGGVCPSVIPKSLLRRYCEQDVDTTHKIFLKQRQELLEQGLLPTAFTRNIFTPVLADIELHGLFLDTELVEELYNTAIAELVQIERELDLFGKGINWGSGPQVAHFVYEDLGFEELKDRRGNFIRNKPSKQFPNGTPKVDADTLLNLKATNKKQRRFIELKGRYSKLSKSISTYLRLFKEACDNNNGYLFGTFNQTVTQTHRLSSSSPNFQNFDRKLKKVFTSRNRDKGWKIGERDAAQLEFRVAAFLGDDAVARQSIADAEDVHGFTASIIFKKEWDKVKDDMSSPKRKAIRTDSKEHTFKPLMMAA